MSKVEKMRADREARWAANHPPAKAKAVKGAHAVVDQPAGEELCGHVSIGNKRCIRPKDHKEVNHRYPKVPRS